MPSVQVTLVDASYDQAHLKSCARSGSQAGMLLLVIFGLYPEQALPFTTFGC
jgi:hypothetical protein